MSIKTFLLSLVLVVIAAVLIASIVIFGNAYLQGGKDADEGDSNAFFFFNKSREVEAAYVEIKNLVITLREDGGKERYLLLDLVVVTSNSNDYNLVVKVTPELKNSAVSMFASLNYSQARGLPVIEMRQDLQNNFNAAIQRPGSKKPISDVLISRMIFQ